MELKNLFRISLVAAAVSLTACGGDINITPTVNDNSVTNNDNSVGDGAIVGGGGSTVDENPCASYGDKQGTFSSEGHCLYSASFASQSIEIDEDITFADLDDDGVHVFEGALLVGQDANTSEGQTINQSGPTMTVEAGATLAFKTGESIVRIARGAKIDAIGTFDKPITFTSAKAFSDLDVVGLGAQFADWGGIQINGNAITDQCTDAERTGGTCNAKAEGITSYYGGDNNADDSGDMAFVNIFYAGSGPRTGGKGDDLNSLTLNAVGSGSSFDFIHIHQGYDDGIEIFGGASTISHVVVTDTQDDAFDFDAGWQGKAQYLFVKHGTVDTVVDTQVLNAREGDDPSTTEVEGDDHEYFVTQVIPAGTPVFMGNNGFETDGRKDKSATEVAATDPVISNVTVITTDGSSVRDEDPSQAFKFDDLVEGQYYNVLMVKADATNGTECIEFKSDAVDAPVADELNFTTSVMACAAEFKAGAGELLGDSAETREVWFENGGSNVRGIDGSAVLAADGISADTSAFSVTATDPTTLDSFFKAGSFVGAVDGSQTSSDWYKWVEQAVATADND